MAADLLLLSSSTVSGGGYLRHAMGAVEELLGDRRTVHFAPYALADHDGYTRRVQAALEPIAVQVVGLHEVDDPRAAIEEAGVLFVGGGNSFRLLRDLQRLGLVEPVRRRVDAGALRFMGSSAGTNMACPSLRTTNDMPIVRPTSFECLSLIPFQINPHYPDPDSGSRHMGETRDQRIGEFLEENDVPVLGMREGAWLRRREHELVLDGPNGARLFRRGAAPLQLERGADLSWLLGIEAYFDRQI